MECVLSVTACFPFLPHIIARSYRWVTSRDKLVERTTSDTLQGWQLDVISMTGSDDINVSGRHQHSQACKPHLKIYYRYPTHRSRLYSISVILPCMKNNHGLILRVRNCQRMTIFTIPLIIQLFSCQVFIFHHFYHSYANLRFIWHIFSSAVIFIFGFGNACLWRMDHLK